MVGDDDADVDVVYDDGDDDDDDLTIPITPFLDYPTPYDSSLSVDKAMDWQVNAIPK